jgi:hypothetical protein
MKLANQGPQDLWMEEYKIHIPAGKQVDVEPNIAKKILKIFGKSSQCCILDADKLEAAEVEAKKAEAEAEAKSKATEAKSSVVTDKPEIARSNQGGK